MPLIPAKEMSSRRPYRTEGLFDEAFPTLKRGANDRCAYGAIASAFLLQQSISPHILCALYGTAEGVPIQSGVYATGPVVVSPKFVEEQLQVPIRLGLRLQSSLRASFRLRKPHRSRLAALRMTAVFMLRTLETGH
jgi:hypothetical protein